MLMSSFRLGVVISPLAAIPADPAEGLATASDGSFSSPCSEPRADGSIDGLGAEMVSIRRDAESWDGRSGADLAACLTDMGITCEVLRANENLDLSLREREIDACVLALHGPTGGSGAVQSLLTMRGVPHSGPRARVASLAFDKLRSRQLMAYHNLPVPAAIAIGTHDDAAPRDKALLGWPCVLKPRHGAHGAAVTRLEGPHQLEAAMAQVAQLDDDMVLERYFEGSEFQVVLLDDHVLGVMEITHDPDQFGSVRSMQCPPQLSRTQLEGVHNLAQRAAASVGAVDGFTRVDILRSPRHNEIVLEVEASPPLDRDGVVMRIARARGMTYESAVAEVVARIPKTASWRSHAETTVPIATLQ